MYNSFLRLRVELDYSPAHDLVSQQDSTHLGILVLSLVDDRLHNDTAHKKIVKLTRDKSIHTFTLCTDIN